jgi:sucrose-6-phosphate hydrolase SacC (GH32 family)
MPQIHFTPPCFRDVAPPHDIAAALWEPSTDGGTSGKYHMFPGCWHAKPGGWQHMMSNDLVSWSLVGEPMSLGGSGGLILDKDNNEVVAYSDSVNMWTTNLSAFDKPAKGWKNEGNAFTQAGGGDPVIWNDERDGRWYAITANGRGGASKNPDGCGREEYWSSPILHGEGAAWTAIKEPFLLVKQTALSRVGSWVRPREFVTPDFFPLGMPTKAGAWVFLTTDYGLCGGVKGAVQLPGCSAKQGMNFSREFDYASYYIGDRPPPGGAFKPDTENEGVWDWSPFTPGADGSQGFEFATAKGMEQFGCCPKTCGGPGGRRILFGWINNGWDQV